MKKIISILLLVCWVLVSSAQEQDSVRLRMDSLQRELQEMKMKELVLRNEGRLAAQGRAETPY